MADSHSNTEFWNVYKETIATLAYWEDTEVYLQRTNLNTMKNIRFCGRQSYIKGQDGERKRGREAVNRMEESREGDERKEERKRREREKTYIVISL